MLGISFLPTPCNAHPLFSRISTHLQPPNSFTDESVDKITTEPSPTPRNDILGGNSLTHTHAEATQFAVQKNTHEFSHCTYTQQEISQIKKDLSGHFQADCIQQTKQEHESSLNKYEKRRSLSIE